MLSQFPWHVNRCICPSSTYKLHKHTHTHMKETYRETQTDRQEKQTDKQRQADWETNKLRERWTERQTDWDRWTERQADWETDGLRDRSGDRDRQRQIDSDGQAETDRHGEGDRICCKWVGSIRSPVGNFDEHCWVSSVSIYTLLISQTASIHYCWAAEWSAGFSGISMHILRKTHRLWFWRCSHTGDFSVTLIVQVWFPLYRGAHG